MFYGEHSHSIDSKGRLVVPSEFRDQLGDEFVITRGADGCLFVYQNTAWKEFEQKLTSAPVADRNARNAARFFLGGACACSVDRQGRILIPASLRKFAELDKDVMLVGMGNRIEIWDKQKYDSWEQSFDMEEAFDNLKEYGI